MFLTELGVRVDEAPPAAETMSRYIRWSWNGCQYEAWANTLPCESVGTDPTDHVLVTVSLPFRPWVAYPFMASGYTTDDYVGAKFRLDRPDEITMMGAVIRALLNQGENTDV